MVVAYFLHCRLQIFTDVVRGVAAGARDCFWMSCYVIADAFLDCARCLGCADLSFAAFSTESLATPTAVHWSECEPRKWLNVHAVGG